MRMSVHRPVLRDLPEGCVSLSARGMEEWVIGSSDTIFDADPADKTSCAVRRYGAGAMPFPNWCVTWLAERRPTKCSPSGAVGGRIPHPRQKREHHARNAREDRGSLEVENRRSVYRTLRRHVLLRSSHSIQGLPAIRAARQGSTRGAMLC